MLLLIDDIIQIVWLMLLFVGNFSHKTHSCRAFWYQVLLSTYAFWYQILFSIDLFQYQMLFGADSFGTKTFSTKKCFWCWRCLLLKETCYWKGIVMSRTMYQNGLVLKSLTKNLPIFQALFVKVSIFLIILSRHHLLNIAPSHRQYNSSF